MVTPSRESFYAGLGDLIVCPRCHADLEDVSEGLRCRGCGVEYPVSPRGVPLLLDPAAFDATRQDYVSDLPERPQTGLAGALRRFVLANQWILGPSIAKDRGKGARIAELRRRFEREGVVAVSVGSQGRGLWPGMICVDVYETPGVHLCCDAHDLPFADASVDLVVSTSLFEHLRDPRRAAAEATRILKPGGECYLEVPWMYEVHGDPMDFQRWTLPGLRALFGDLDAVDCGVTEGPATTWARMTRQAVASFFPQRLPYYAVRAAMTWLLWWVRYFDALVPQANRQAMAMGYWVRFVKPSPAKSSE